LGHDLINLSILFFWGGGRLHPNVFIGIIEIKFLSNTNSSLHFDVLLTVHLSIILVINQLSAENLVL